MASRASIEKRRTARACEQVRERERGRKREVKFIVKKKRGPRV